MFRTFLILASVLMVAVLTYSSIFLPPPPQIFEDSDKWLHLAVYAVIGFWFVSLFQRYWFLILLICVGTGFALEYLQGLTAYRQASLWDGVANGMGCLLGLAMARICGLYLNKYRPVATQ